MTKQSAGCSSGGLLILAYAETSTNAPVTQGLGYAKGDVIDLGDDRGDVEGRNRETG